MYNIHIFKKKKSNSNHLNLKYTKHILVFSVIYFLNKLVLKLNIFLEIIYFLLLMYPKRILGNQTGGINFYLGVFRINLVENKFKNEYYIFFKD